MVSWVVDKSAGEPPYLFTAVITNKDLLDGVNYVLEVANSGSGTACPTDPSLGANIPTAAASVMATNMWNKTQAAINICISTIVRIRRISDNSIFDYKIATVNNIP